MHAGRESAPTCANVFAHDLLGAVTVLGSRIATPSPYPVPATCSPSSAPSGRAAWFGNKTTPANLFDPSPESKFENRPEFELESLHRTAMIGTPGEVIDRLRTYEQLGIDEFSFWCDNSMSHDEKRASLELFIKEVLPAFT